MDTPPDETVPPAARCAAESARLLSRYRSELLGQEEHARLMLARLAAGATADVRYAAFSTYSEAVYAACAGHEGAERQEQAYKELERYLGAAARFRYPEGGAELVQQAVGAVYLDFASCREPRAFLAFALLRLANAARAARRQRARASVSLDALADGEDGAPALAEPASPGPDPAGSAIQAEQRQRLLELAARFGQQHPRARQQLAALLLKFLHGLDDRTISRLLRKPVASVYVLRSRAIARLRDDAAWRSLAAEMGLLGARG